MELANIHIPSLTMDVDNSNLTYQLQQWRSRLLRLSSKWQQDLTSHWKASESTSPWGVYEEDLQFAHHNQMEEWVQEIEWCGDESGGDTDSEGSSIVDDSDLDPGLIEHLHTLDLVDSQYDTING